MRELSADVAKRISGQATFAGAKLVKQAAHPQRAELAVDRDRLAARLDHHQEGAEGPAEGPDRGAPGHRARPRQATNKKGQKINRAPHAHFVEFGTVNMPAEPFLRPAFDQEKGAAAQAIADRLSARIAKVKPKP
jgi:HK97 gp10 family phage protein